MTTLAPAPEAAPSELRGIIDRGDVRAVYQPIHRLKEAEIVGFEALARGPSGSPLERPDPHVRRGPRGRPRR